MKSPELPSSETHPTPPAPEPSPQTPELSRELVYADSFKEMIREHPGVIKSFNMLMDKISPESEKKKGTLKFGDILEDGEVQIKVISATGEELHEGMPVKKPEFFKAKVGDELFFVKIRPGLRGGTGRGAEEFRSLEEASKALEGMDRVKVIDFQLGYQDEDRTYFVSKWKDAVMLSDYLIGFNRRIISGETLPVEEEVKRQELRSREKIIGTILHENGFEDFHFDNVLYEPATDIMYVFDVHKKREVSEE